jgi:MoaA/NifB/PqqE/SkfB family radical SAM enzyme
VPADHWNRVGENVQDLVLARGHATAPTIGISFVVNRDNYREVVEACAIAKDLGVDNFRIAAMIQPEDAVYFRDFHDEAVDLVGEAQEMSTDTFEVINLYGQRLEDFTIGHPDYRDCSYQQLTTYIGADLSVYHCCITAYTERGTAGSLKDQTFREFWSSAEKRARYASFDARGCPRCQFNAQNREIAKMIESLPAVHGNFV